MLVQFNSIQLTCIYEIQHILPEHLLECLFLPSHYCINCIFAVFHQNGYEVSSFTWNANWQTSHKSHVSRSTLGLKWICDLYATCLYFVKHWERQKFLINLTVISRGGFDVTSFLRTSNSNFEVAHKNQAPHRDLKAKKRLWRSLF